jgi:hypothetical protein
MSLALLKKIKKELKVMIEEFDTTNGFANEDNFITALLGIELAENEVIDEEQLRTILKEEGINNIEDLMRCTMDDVWEDYNE